MRAVSLVGMSILMLGITQLAAAQPMTSTSVTGTVVSSTGDKLVLRTSTGEMTFMMNTTTDRPATLPVGTRATVWYEKASDPAMGHAGTATRITLAEATTAEKQTATEATDYRDPGERAEDLPGTAGLAPLLALIGFASVAGAGAMRMISSRRIH